MGLVGINLCNNDGNLKHESIGFAKNLYISCNLKGKWMRKKKWNYWCITNKDCLFSATISNKMVGAAEEHFGQW